MKVFAVQSVAQRHGLTGTASPADSFFIGAAGASGAAGGVGTLAAGGGVGAVGWVVAGASCAPAPTPPATSSNPAAVHATNRFVEFMIFGSKGSSSGFLFHLKSARTRIARDNSRY